MIISGRSIADAVKQDLIKRITRSGVPVSLGIVTGDAHPATEKYLAVKKKFGMDVGVSVDIRTGDTMNTDAFMEIVRTMITMHKAVIIQLPLPPTLDQEKILALVPKERDVDVLSEEARRAYGRGESPFVPPVLAAIQKVLDEGNISLSGKKIVVVGGGRLVGIPVSEWLSREHVPHTVITKEMGDAEKKEVLQNADIVISGAGVPHMITGDMVKNGVVLIDAGTSAEGGSIAGDIDPACAEKASLFTPVPGGIGPITVAMLYENVLRVHGV